MKNDIENNVYFLELDANFRVLNSDPELEKKLKISNIENKFIYEIFQLSDETKEIISSRKDRTNVLLDDSNIQLTFVPNFHGDEKAGYLLEIIFSEDYFILQNKSKTSFNSDFDYALTKISHDISIGLDFNSLIENILKYVVKISDSSFGALIFIEKNIKEKFSPIVFPEERWLEAQSILANISSNLPKINIWFSFNRNALVFKGNEHDIFEININPSDTDHTYLLAPIFFDNLLLATLLLKSKNNNVNDKFIYKIETFAGILALSISNHLLKEQTIISEKKSSKFEKTEQLIKKANSLAHDFNNVLHTIFLLFSSLRKKLEENNQLEELAINIERNIRLALNISSELLSIGRSQLKKKSVIRPAEIIVDLSKTLKQIIPSKIQINYNIDKEVSDFIGNETEIFQMLLNLVLNAKDAIKDSGNIDVEVANFLKTNSINEPPLIPPGSYVKFSVKDDGVGISQDILPKIFEPYFSTKGTKGTGLGLSIVKEIIQSHNGYIFAESQEGCGSTFTVFIPTTYKREKTESEEGKIILIVDDEEIIRNILAELLEANNFEVICASDPRQALKILKEEIKADLLLIDQNMPEMTGLECVKLIRKINSEIPIILTTGDINKLDMRDIYSLNIDKVLEKPYDFEQVYFAIKSILRKDHD